MKKREPLKNVIAEDVAIMELKNVVEYHLDREIAEDEIAKSYPESVVSLQRGLITFDDDLVPILKLREPVKNDQQEDSIIELKFHTRILVSVQRNLAKGIDLQKDSLAFSNKCMAYLISQPVAMLDKFNKHDLKVIQELSGLFI